MPDQDQNSNSDASELSIEVDRPTGITDGEWALIRQQVVVLLDRDLVKDGLWYAVAREGRHKASLDKTNFPIAQTCV